MVHPHIFRFCVITHHIVGATFVICSWFITHNYVTLRYLAIKCEYIFFETCNVLCYVSNFCFSRNFNFIINCIHIVGSDTQKSPLLQVTLKMTRVCTYRTISNHHLIVEYLIFNHAWYAVVEYGMKFSTISH